MQPLDPTLKVVQVAQLCFHVIYHVFKHMEHQTKLVLGVGDPQIVKQCQTLLTTRESGCCQGSF